MLGGRAQAGVHLHRHFLFGCVCVALEDGRTAKVRKGRRTVEAAEALLARHARCGRVATGGMVGGMIVLWHIPWEYLQPALKIFGRCPLGSPPGCTGLCHVACRLPPALALVAVSIRPLRTLLFSTPCHDSERVDVLAVQHQIMTVVAVALALGRSMPRAAANAPSPAALLSRIGEDRKATMLSLQSLLGRACFLDVVVVVGVARRQDQLGRGHWLVLGVPALGGSILGEPVTSLASEPGEEKPFLNNRHRRFRREPLCPFHGDIPGDFCQHRFVFFLKEEQVNTPACRQV